jgi:hypothetical protein
MFWRVAACVATIVTAPVPARPADGETLPVLYGIRLDNAQVSFDVVSTGCTTASSFSVLLEPVSPGAYRLSITRHEEDRCRMSAHLITLVLDLPAVAELGEARFLLGNRLTSPGSLLRSD